MYTVHISPNRKLFYPKKNCPHNILLIKGEAKKIGPAETHSSDLISSSSSFVVYM